MEPSGPSSAHQQKYSFPPNADPAPPKIPVIEISTDGACFPNPGHGGWGWVTPCGQSHSGTENPSTNQRMEMMAVIAALEHFDGKAAQILIRSDSQFVIKGCTEWMPGWKVRGWCKSDGSIVKNLDLWRRLDELLSRNRVGFQWVRGHNGDEMNERADQLASAATGVGSEERERLERLYAGRKRGWAR